MNKYSDKSDFEINKEVVKLIKTKGGYSCVDYDEIVKVYVSQNTGIYKEFDPCNDPYDAMPIVIENKITVAYDHHDCVWCAYIGSEISTHSDNYYRSAMICFLMMKEAENES
ncbi:phage protein NinX family protein [Morganella morganii]|uniref:phage protein NinX family protein n=1 Tax=Morganella morganii TaxID=582 RepID=UPI003EBBC6EE